MVPELNEPTTEAAPRSSIEQYVAQEWAAPLVLLRKLPSGEYAAVISWDGADPESCRQARDRVKTLQWHLKRHPQEWVP